jgi:VanZ family protein
MIKSLLLNYPLAFRMAFAAYTLLVLWASLRSGGGPQPIAHFDKLMHFSFYALFTFIAAGCTHKFKSFIALSLFIAAYGALMEFFQSFVPSRFMSVADILANSSGVALVAFIIVKSNLYSS